MTETKRVLVFCDPGIDDALALVYLADHPSVEIAGVVAVAGNVTARQAEVNATHVLSEIGTAVPVYGTSHLEQYSADASEYHGTDGLGGLSSGSPCDSHPPRQALSFEGAFDILSLGPCTMVVDFSTENDFSSLYLMGGLIGDEGNFHGLEYNFYLDPDSAQRLLQKHNPFVIPLEAGRELKKLPHVRRGRDMFESLNRQFLALARKRSGIACYYDLVAAIAYAEPERFEWSMLPVRVSHDTSVEALVATFRA